MGGHMKHVDTKGKGSYNYALTSGNVKESDIETFKENLSKSAFVGKHQVFTFKTNPLRMILMNLLIKVKGFISPSNLTPSQEKLADIEKLYTGENFKNKSPKVMINVIKNNEKNKADIDEYTTKVIFDLFPVIKSRIFEAGSVTDDYWDQFAMMEY